ncbi:hypothetical protein [Sphingobium tyrosinilyticum]|uniref:EthD domain-containing protein n=1 Tax=Sphingobium tyrosinilyticum TaxID=2715436 RepID=A0ABV9F3A9_9SPHN
MARFTYMILNRAKPGQAEEFKRWYAEQHLSDVRRVEGVVDAKLFAVDFQKDYDLDLPNYDVMTIYELECDDPEAKIEEIKALSGTSEMVGTDTIEKSGMAQAVGHLIRQV